MIVDKLQITRSDPEKYFNDAERLKCLTYETTKEWIEYFIDSFSDLSESRYSMTLCKDINYYLHSYATSRGLTLEECVDHAYNTIKNRKGKMVNGVFVKESAR
ncbi:MAG: hypothetical protein Q4P25_06015 [Tissierellia bacterium]|nr:hypothetical protein [Tissierellia bacterium]